ncbi:uncharacterized protein PV07_08683 [Cladophialophora immunda]|uniref:Uncharacterized protein n=1 Tax=Cladophialophora immunda TaxID=569365 RepID=A0A0D2AKP5_9EURO|nr:uncharacterized protein PV07_08683 [Cladophialophora immunda]KIW25517.1 hypothetical protein PV07_08683 [Cladophialophora immunda]
MFHLVGSDPRRSYMVTLLQPANLDQFIHITDTIMHTPAFGPRSQTALQYSLRYSAISLNKSSQAMLSALLWARHVAITWDQVDLESGASSLQHLRTASVSSVEEALAVAMFGQTLTANDTITTGRGSSLILRHSLTLLKPRYPALVSNPFTETITTAPIRSAERNIPTNPQPRPCVTCPTTNSRE